MRSAQEFAAQTRAKASADAEDLRREAEVDRAEAADALRAARAELERARTEADRAATVADETAAAATQEANALMDSARERCRLILLAAEDRGAAIQKAAAQEAEREVERHAEPARARAAQRLAALRDEIALLEDQRHHIRGQLAQLADAMETLSAPETADTTSQGALHA